MRYMGYIAKLPKFSNLTKKLTANGKKRLPRLKPWQSFLSPLDGGGAGDLAFAVANLEEREVVALLVADSQDLAQAALLRKVNIKAEWAWLGQILNR